MDVEQIYQIYSKIVLIRFVEEAIVKEYPQQEIRTPVHLYLGQEAIASAISVHLEDEDYIVSNHRSHGHCLAKGLSLEGFFGELYGKEYGVCRGKGGSMHLVDMSKGILGTSAIVAGGIPIGAGAALKQKINNEKNITVIYFGDGAVDEGVFWETINFSSLKKLPILFVMEDNKYASQTHFSMRHAYKDITDAVKAFEIPTYKIDGNCAIEVAEVSKKVIKSIRAGNGPAFMYCETYRWMGHVGVHDDTDTGYRKKEEVEYWRVKCPLSNIENKLIELDPMNHQNRMEEIKRSYQKIVDDAIKSAKEMPYAVD